MGTAELSGAVQRIQILRREIIETLLNVAILSDGIQLVVRHSLSPCSGFGTKMIPKPENGVNLGAAIFISCPPADRSARGFVKSPQDRAFSGNLFRSPAILEKNPPVGFLGAGGREIAAYCQKTVSALPQLKGERSRSMSFTNLSIAAHPAATRRSAGHERGPHQPDNKGAQAMPALRKPSCAHREAGAHRRAMSARRCTRAALMPRHQS